MRITSVVLLALALLGCTTTPARSPLAAQVLHRGSQCGLDSEGPAVEWLTSAEQYRHAVGDDGLPATESIDFSERGVLLVDMGQRPTAGYGLAFRDAYSEGAAEVEVEVEWQEPAADAITAQVLTSPCLLVSLPQQDYAEIRVVDQTGEVRLQYP